MIRGSSLAKAMRANSSVPGLRKIVQYGDKLLVDGGVVCNVPVKQCRQMGADIIIAVNIDEPFSEVQLHEEKHGSVRTNVMRTGSESEVTIEHFQCVEDGSGAADSLCLVCIVSSGDCR